MFLEHGDVPGLADGQGMCGVSVLLYWIGWTSSQIRVDELMQEQDSKTFVAVDKLTEQQLYLDVSVAMIMSVLAAGVPLMGFRPKHKSPLEKVSLKASVSVYKFTLHVHLEASMAVHEVVLQHLKVCGHA